MAPPPPSTRVRLKVLAVVVACLFATLFVRLWYLEVINAPAAAQETEAANDIVTVYIPAPRGEILDRNGTVLVTNIDEPVIEVQQQDATDRPMVTLLATLLGMTTTALQKAIANPQYSPYAPVPVLTGASAKQILYIDEHQSLFPGVTATTQSEPQVTPAGEYAAAVLGYVGQVDSQDLATLQKKYPHAGYQAGDVVGLSGIEAEYDNVLRGKPGAEKIQLNAQGQVLSVLSHTPPVPGDNLRLTIDANVQKVASQSILQGQAAARATRADTGSGNYTSPGGSAVVEDPNNGQILALATEPTFDPNEFNNGGISQAQYNAYADNPDDPLENRAIQGEYAPGSTFKLVTATAGFKYGIITPTSIYDDTGSISIGGQVFHDDGGIGAGLINVSQALTVSSDNFFNNIGINLWDNRAADGQTALQNVADAYGLNADTGIGLPAESSGVIPTPALFAEQYKQDPQDFTSPDWYTGDSAITAIGQGEVLVTPLQLDNAYAAFANGGTLYKPQIVLDAETLAGKVVTTYQPTAKGHTPALTAAERQAMISGYLGVTHDPSGTAYPIFGSTNSLSADDIAGKTGTAQVEGKQDTSVFIGFAPATGTQYVVDCFMEDSGYGESVAAPIVREIYDQIYHQPLSPVSYVTATGNAT